MRLIHLIGLALAVGSSTVKLALLVRCIADPGLVPAYLKVVRPITRLLVLGLILLTLSGIGALALGYSFTRVLLVKLILVAAVWTMGPIIDKIMEPRFRELAPEAGEAASPNFIQARTKYVTLEAVATATFYVIVVIWVML